MNSGLLQNNENPMGQLEKRAGRQSEEDNRSTKKAKQGANKERSLMNFRIYSQ